MPVKLTYIGWGFVRIHLSDSTEKQLLLVRKGIDGPQPWNCVCVTLER